MDASPCIGTGCSPVAVPADANAAAGATRKCEGDGSCAGSGEPGPCSDGDMGCAGDIGDAHTNSTASAGDCAARGVGTVSIAAPDTVVAGWAGVAHGVGMPAIATSGIGSGAEAVDVAVVAVIVIGVARAAVAAEATAVAETAVVAPLGTVSSACEAAVLRLLELPARLSVCNESTTSDDAGAACFFSDGLMLRKNSDCCGMVRSRSRSRGAPRATVAAAGTRRPSASATTAADATAAVSAADVSDNDAAVVAVAEAAVVAVGRASSSVCGGSERACCCTSGDAIDDGAADMSGDVTCGCVGATAEAPSSALPETGALASVSVLWRGPWRRPTPELLGTVELDAETDNATRPVDSVGAT